MSGGILNSLVWVPLLTGRYHTCLWKTDRGRAIYRYRVLALWRRQRPAEKRKASETRSVNRPQMFTKGHKRRSARRSTAWRSHREGDTRPKGTRRDQARAGPRIRRPLARGDATGTLFNDKPNEWSKPAASECRKRPKPRLSPQGKPCARARPLPVTHKRSPRRGRAMPRK